MVDIHIRDIADLSKRQAVVTELIEKYGREDLIFEILPPPNFKYYGNCYKLLLFGSYKGRLCRLDQGLGKVPFGTSSRLDEHLLSVTGYKVWKGSSTYDEKNGWEKDEEGARLGSYVVSKTFEVEEGRHWNVVITTADLIRIYTPAAVEPVVKLKEIEAEAS